MNLTEKQKLVLAQYKGRMRTKRLRKKLLKYPERYYKEKTLNKLFKFEYSDAAMNLIPDTSALLRMVKNAKEFRATDSFPQPFIVPIGGF